MSTSLPRSVSRVTGQQLVAAMATLAMHAALFAVPAHAAGRCELGAFRSPADTTLVSVRAFAAPVRYCRIDGYVTTTNPGPNDVKFMVALPEEFNGRYVFTIQGGAAAFVPDPTEKHLRAGYAIASTDKGVKAAHVLDFTFRNDPAQSMDWSHRGVHVVAQATQELVRQHYVQTDFHRYAMGCSGGGDGTLAAAEKHPEDFDGYIAAAMTTSELEITTIWGKIAQYLVRHPDAWLSPQELARVEKVFMDRYDAADGAVDGHIWDPSVIELDRESLAFLDARQFGILKMIQAGIDAGEGARYPGYWMGNPTGFSTFLFGTKRPPWTPGDRPPDVPAGLLVADSSARAIRGPDYDVLASFDFESAQQLREDRRLNLGKGRETFDPAALAAFRASGRKLILWSGSADPAVPPRNILDYTRAADRLYTPAGRAGFIRTFFVPGMFHCFGGVEQPTDVPDVMLDAAVHWVEQGKAPDRVVAHNDTGARDVIREFNREVSDFSGVDRDSSQGRTFLLCAWPGRSVFKGGVSNPDGLNVNNAANWRCE